LIASLGRLGGFWKGSKEQEAKRFWRLFGSVKVSSYNFFSLFLSLQK
jgi:hypothetical protein